jgi:prevent-host-death family protein
MEVRMAAFGIADAKMKFSSLIERAAAGEDITITKHGKPLVKLVRAAAHDPEAALKAFEELRKVRKGTTLGGLDWKALRDEGRR